MDLRLKGLDAVISASGTPVASAIAQQLVGEGAKVTVVTEDDTLADAVSEAGCTLVRAPIGVDMPDAVEAALETADIWVHDVYDLVRKPFADATIADWTARFEADVLTSVLLAKTALPSMTKRGNGRMIFVISATALMDAEDSMPSAVTKAAQLALCHRLARTTRGTGVTVNAVLAGAIRTQAVMNEIVGIGIREHTIPQVAEHRFIDTHLPSALLERLVEPAEIASIVTYLASPISAASNGAIFRADGGAAPPG